MGESTHPFEKTSNEVFSGKEMAAKANLAAYLREIKNLVSCPDDAFNIYNMTALRVAEYCQLIPASKIENSENDEFLNRQFKLAIAALKLRRGLFFPKNAGAELIALQEPQWTYAIFTAALLQNFYQILKDNEVIHKVVPLAALKWLQGNKVLFNEWQEVIHQDFDNKHSSQNGMYELIVDASKKTAPIILQENVEKIEVGETENIIQQFMTKLIDSSIHNPGSVLRTNSGVFVNTDIIDNCSQEHTSRQDLLQELEKTNNLILNINDIYHTLTPKNLEDRTLLKGVILNIDFVPEILANLPVTQTYLENFSL